jgi:WD40 repeat protein
MTVLNHDDPDSIHLTHDFNAVVWSPDGRYIVGAHDDGIVRIGDVRSLHSGWVRKVVAHALWIGCLAMSPDGKGLVSGCEAGTLKYWDVDWSGDCRGGWKGSSARAKGTEGNPGRMVKLSTPLHEFSEHKVFPPFFIGF